MKFTKTTKTPCECGSRYYTRELSGSDGADKWVWQCGNCRAQKPCGKEKTRKVGADGMTSAQRRMVEKIRKEHLAIASHGIEDYEQKSFEVTVKDGSVVVDSVVGRKNDEGTAAFYYCRDRRCVYIREGGGVQLMNAKTTKKVIGYYKVMHEAVY